MRLLPDWTIYLLTLCVVLWVLFSGSDKDAPPPPPEAINEEGGMLPPASVLDEPVLVQVTSPRDGAGTAFAINTGGDWLTARHVVDGCSTVSLLIGRNTYTPARQVKISNRSDLALLETDLNTRPVTLDTGAGLQLNSLGFHVGYPQGRPGEVSSRLLSRSRLISRGHRRGNEPVLTWAETGRTRGLFGSLAGLSGAPVYDSNGLVRGVVVAESARRGRLYTSAPEAIARFIKATDVDLAGQPPRRFTTQSYGSEADFARRNLQVVKIACDIDGT